MFVRHTKRCLIITVMFGTVFFWLYASGRADSAKNYLELPYVVVHIDLKGMPPKMSYLKSILPQLKELGANALLMEYEDMFPYEGSIRNISSKHAYSKLELSEFLREAQKFGFEIIPLVQTFGHLEFVLKHWEFAQLRENPFSPDSICPTNDDSHTLIETMLQQVFQFHDNISPLKHFHIGCDEVYNINLCPRCKERKLQNLVLFVDHVNNVHRILKSFNKSISILIWDDMIRKLKRSSFVILNRLQDIEPVYWKYNPGVTDAHRPLIFYKRRFKHTWIATAFKGADGRTRMLPNLQARLHNNFDWLKNMFDYRHIYSFKGIILTGWAKYGHLDPPCEVLPASMPSLTLNLLLIQKYKQGLDLNSSTLTAGLFYRKHIEPHLERELKCNLEYRISLKYSNIHDCKLASRKLIKVLYNFGKFHKLIVQTYFNDRAGLDTVDYYYKKYNVVSNNLHYHKNWANESLRTLEYYAKYLSVYLYEYYDDHLINEYVNFRTEYLKQLITQLHLNLISLDTIRVYDRESNQFHIYP